MQDQIYDMLLKEDEVTWQDIIYSLVKSGQIDPWNVDVGKLTRQYIDAVKSMKEMNYFVSGKVLLATAILLRIKSNRLVDEDISTFDAFLFHTEDEGFEELDSILPVGQHRITDIPILGVKTPQARKRKVSITDLIQALERALHVDTRRRLRLQRFLTLNVPQIPQRKVDMGKLIQDVYQKVITLFGQKEIVLFTDLVPGTKKEDTVLTLLPLLHLHHEKKLTIEQHEPFGEIRVQKAPTEEQCS